MKVYKINNVKTNIAWEEELLEKRKIQTGRMLYEN